MVKGWDTNEMGTYYFNPMYGTMAKGRVVAEVVHLVNEERAKEGLSPLEVDTTLQAAAQLRVAEIVTSFSHKKLNGKSCFTVLQENDISYRK